MIEEYRWLIKKYAHSYTLTSNLSFEDLEQQAYLIASEAILSWDPTLGSLPGRVKYKVCTGLRDYVKKNSICSPIEQFKVTRIVDFRTPEKAVILKETFSLLSDDAKEVLNILLSEIDLCNPPKVIRGELKKILRGKAMTWSRIWSCFKELKSITQLPA